MSQRQDKNKAYPRYAPLYKKLTRQSSTLVFAEHLLQNWSGQAKQLFACVLGQHLLHSAQYNKHTDA